jgi:hypothetical protein
MSGEAWIQVPTISTASTIYTASGTARIAPEKPGSAPLSGDFLL